MGTRILDWFSRYWKRKTDRPDYRQAYVKLPLDTDLPSLASEFERVCEGRLDRVPRRDSLVVDTDFIPEARFDGDRFAELVAELKARSPERYALYDSTKWRRHEGGVAKMHTVVPVKRLYSVDEESTAYEPSVSDRPR
ncbi:hypothetical protein BG842_19900 [Haladaptatus sp. W1]|uniref:hypothetical protein n=1 Tax=Haladaptatus sp. W1 TaxID=1897478 RepID=UPI000849CD49|nr:hypothetical protein [Haladaptatus sp. W1]ODR83272.1 hypothetical protein BG842_19900 [Haladaptatus sp. W1]